MASPSMEILPHDPDLIRQLRIGNEGLQYILENEARWRRECPGYITVHRRRFLGSNQNREDARRLVASLGLPEEECTTLYLHDPDVLRVGV